MSIEQLLETDIEKRDGQWEQNFLQTLPSAKIRVLTPEPQEGPDHWPYLMISTEAGDDTFSNLAMWLSTRGIGLAINPEKPMPDFVLTYGMVWNFRERGEIMSKPETPAPASGRIEIREGQQLYTGAPSEAYLPKYVRSVIKQFLADQGIFTPKVLMIGADQENFDLCFSIESLKAPPAHEHANIAEALAWFLPAHYSVALVSEKTVPGFTNL